MFFKKCVIICVEISIILQLFNLSFLNWYLLLLVFALHEELFNLFCSLFGLAMQF